jgi:glycosyltransferase involved in cell wall biosynthesis
MISVVIGTYNRAGMVREAIKAALAQTQPPDEIVVSDDASTDETWEGLQVAAEQDSRIRIFRLAKNSGGVANWNRAFAQTRGDFIAMCSDDDRYLPGHLEGSVAYLKAHPHVGLVHSSFIDSLEKFDSWEVVPRPLRSTDPLTLDRHNLLRYLIRYYDWPFHPSTIVMRREVWNRLGPFDEQYALFDTEWFVRAAERFPVTMLPRHGVINRRHAGNWSNRLGSARMQREIFQIVERSIRRQSRGRRLRRTMWRALWRANVRMRLALTLRARLKTGHADAALAAWEALCHYTGRSLPSSIERAGVAVIRRYSSRRTVQPSESVSPL